MSILSMLPATIERHELKYTIPWQYVDEISHFIAPYCELDRHSADADNHFYLVNSLYLDTRGFEFLRQRLYGKDGRFNVRVRCYGNEGEPPYFLEIKRKSGTSGKKFRASAGRDEWPNILTDPAYVIPENDTPEERINKERFMRIATAYAIEPKLLTQYTRRAFFSTVDDYARVTMDVSMKYRVQDHYSLIPDEHMISYDNQTIYTKEINSKESVVLELKCNIGEVPMWMLDLISTFNLKQQGFSKYANSSLVSHFDNGLNYMSGDRIACGCL